MIVNRWGKPLDDLDTLKMQVFASEMMPAGASYSVSSADGVPLCGRVMHDAPRSIYLTAPEWRTKTSLT